MGSGGVMASMIFCRLVPVWRRVEEGVDSLARGVPGRWDNSSQGEERAGRKGEWEMRAGIGREVREGEDWMRANRETSAVEREVSRRRRRT